MSSGIRSRVLGVEVLLQMVEAGGGREGRIAGEASEQPG